MDKLPPHDSNAEMCVIGSCIISPKDCLPEAQEKISTPQFFYDERCKEAWILLCSKQLHEIDIISLSSEINHQFLLECQDLVPSSANLSVWIEIISEKYLLRRIIQVSTNLISIAYESPNANELLDAAEHDILAIRPNQKESNDIKSLVHQAIDKIEHKCLSGDSITGLSTGISDLDKQTDGLHGGEMIVIAALPSRGKTGLAVNIAVHNALKGCPVAIFSAEMRPVQLVVRSICSESRVNFKKISQEDVPKMTVAASRLSTAPLFIEQASGFSIGQIRAIARRLHQKHGIKLIVIDYQQRLTGTGDNQEQRVASISNGVKDLAMELNVPVILLSQVNKDGETKHAKATTEDADSLWKIENDGEWEHEVQPVNLNVEKSRDGETGQVKLTFLKTITRFEQAAKFSNDDIPKSNKD